MNQNNSNNPKPDVPHPDDILIEITENEYKYGFTTDIETDIIGKGLSEATVRLISQKKGEPEWLLDFRLKAYRHWLTLKQPDWAHLYIPPIDYNDIIYYAAPRKHVEEKKEIDPELIKTFDKLGIPLRERDALAGNTAVDAVMDRVSSSAHLTKQLRITPIWYGDIWAKWYLIRIITLQRLIRRFLVMDRLSIYLRAFVVLWNFPHTSGSMRAIRVNLSERL